MKTIPSDERFTAVLSAVAHKQFCELKAHDWEKIIIPNGVIMDLKGIVPRSLNAYRL